MKSLLKTTIAAASAIALTAGVSLAQYESDQDQILQVLAQYETALNASNTPAVMQLYAKDGVFMPQHSQSHVGHEAVQAAYNYVFETITLNVEFEITEVHVISPEWAFARTNSAGKVTINATGDSGPEANQELFIFCKQSEGDWKIARYAFSTTNPPK
ncbi:MAG: SgcJ/EcaC family oxidoreductase [Kordiimonadaceae bacterium]|nr:SgcJ/EcaC family oxidoreductase [Kordiimonadaceae bacterium]MBO6570457.1 SgcJ/EcaC family oxidoreductase [Kordiimonadaceae bacterium]MBO6966424.1 SgcJ/EcaC family oxidoreductase [Kordiimonadaceae bacterium]